jgi:hypothetical protein
MHVPTPSSPAKKQIKPRSQLSTPVRNGCSNVHGSSSCPGSRAISTQRVAFQIGPPSSEYGMHFSPGGQSCAYRSHDGMPWPMSGHPASPLSSEAPLQSPGGGALEAPELLVVAPLPVELVDAGAPVVDPEP